MKKALVSLLAVACLSANASDEGKANEQFKIDNVHGFFQLGANHVWRGISFSNRTPEIFGALLLVNHGFYIGMIGYDSFLSAGGMGAVPIIGYKGEFDEVDYDISVRYEHYAKDITLNSSDISELYGKLGYKLSEYFKVRVGLAYSPDYYFESGTGWYYEGGVELKFPYDVTIDGDAGRQQTQNGGSTPAFWFKNYWHWGIGISKDFGSIILGFRYTDTNLGDTECLNLGVCEPAYNIYAKKTF